MEEKDLFSREEKIRLALEGKENEYSPVISQLELSFRALQDSLSLPSSTDYPRFDDIWSLSRIDAGDRDFQPLNQESINIPRSFPWKKFATAALVLLSLGLYIFYPTGEEPSYQAKVLHLHGEAFFLNSDKTPRQSLQNFQTVESGERILVEEKGFLDLEIASYAALRISGGSEILFQSMTESPTGDKIKIYLKQGKIAFKIGKMKKTNEFIVETELGDIQVRGTRFLVEKRDDRLQVGVTEGKVVFQRINDEIAESSGNKSIDSDNPSSEIYILPQFQMLSGVDGVTQSPLSRVFRKDLAELDYISPKIQPEYKAIQSEDDLYNLYSLLERVETEDGKIINGVIYGMDETHIYIRTVRGEMKIPQNRILNVEKIR